MPTAMPLWRCIWAKHRSEVMWPSQKSAGTHDFALLEGGCVLETYPPQKMVFSMDKWVWKPGSMFTNTKVIEVSKQLEPDVLRYRQLIVEAAQGHLQEALSVGVTWSMLAGKAGILLRIIVWTWKRHVVGSGKPIGEKRHHSPYSKAANPITFGVDIFLQTSNFVGSSYE